MRRQTTCLQLGAIHHADNRLQDALFYGHLLSLGIPYVLDRPDHFILKYCFPNLSHLPLQSGLLIMPVRLVATASLRPYPLLGVYQHL